MKAHDTPEKNYDLERLIFFSDGVFAIAITLLVIEMHPPEHWDGSFAMLVGNIAPRLLFYIISFAAIGAFWMIHRIMFRHVRAFSETASWINLLFLAEIGLTPLANTLLGEGHLSLDIIWVYVGLMVLISLTGGLLWTYMSFIARVVDPALSFGFRIAMLVRMSIVPPVLCSISLWIGQHFGLLPAAGFVVAGVFLSSLIRSRPRGTTEISG